MFREDCLQLPQWTALTLLSVSLESAANAHFTHLKCIYIVVSFTNQKCESQVCYLTVSYVTVSSTLLNHHCSFKMALFYDLLIH